MQYLHIYFVATSFKMDMEFFSQKILDQLYELSDQERIEKTKFFAPTSMEILGITSPIIKEQINFWWKELKTCKPEQFIALVKRISDTKILECRIFAYELLWKNKNALALLKIKDLNELKEGNDNWVCVDTFCVCVSGWVWRNKQISDDDVCSWLKSENRWERRTAVVSTVPLNLKSRGGKGDPERTLMICKEVINDRDDMVVKALSWALRELSKSDKTAVQNFMDNYSPQLAGRVVREVNTKLTTGRKSG